MAGAPRDRRGRITHKTHSSDHWVHAAALLGMHDFDREHGHGHGHGYGYDQDGADADAGGSLPSSGGMEMTAGAEGEGVPRSPSLVAGLCWYGELGLFVSLWRCEFALVQSKPLESD